MDSGLARRSGMIVLLLVLASRLACAQKTTLDSGTAAPSAADLSIPQSQLIQPEALIRLLKAAGHDRPLVLQVGSRVLYAEAHIPGAEYTGPAGLEARVESLPRTRFIVLYCGCCTLNRCCNAAPAFTKLRNMGFTNVKVLYLADNFGISWVNRGYRFERDR
jgi:thiosulfate/3-mercaptopyruvate sulfurtransferase